MSCTVYFFFFWNVDGGGAPAPSIDQPPLAWTQTENTQGTWARTWAQRRLGLTWTCATLGHGCTWAGLGHGQDLDGDTLRLGPRLKTRWGFDPN